MTHRNTILNHSRQPIVKREYTTKPNENNNIFQQINQLSQHNLCTHKKNPDELSILLRLGLKFCIKDEKSCRNTFEHIFDRMRRDVRIKLFFAR